jgi:hypothetical protein
VLLLAGFKFGCVANSGVSGRARVRRQHIAKKPAAK